MRPSQWQHFGDWMRAEKLVSRRIPASAVMTTGNVVDDEHIAARKFIVEWDQVDVGRRRFPGFPVHFERPAEVPMRGCSGLGDDNERVLTSVLGYSKEQVEKLTAAGVLATRPPGT